MIPDDTDSSYKNYADSVKHIACDRKDVDAVKEKVSSGGFEGTHLRSSSKFPGSTGFGKSLRDTHLLTTDYYTPASGTVTSVPVNWPKVRRKQMSKVHQVLRPRDYDMACH